MYLELVKHYLTKTMFIFVIILAGIWVFSLGMLEGSLLKTIPMSSYFTCFMYFSITAGTHKMFSSLPVSRNKLILADYTAYTILLLFNYLIIFGTFYLLKLMLHNDNLTDMKISPLSLMTITFSLSLLAKCMFDLITSQTAKVILTFVISFLGLFAVVLGAALFTKFTGYSPEYILYPLAIIITSITFFVTKWKFPRLDF